MAFIGNLVWLILGGWILGLAYILGTLILFPLLPLLLPMISYVFLPFGRKPVSKKAVRAYKIENNMPVIDDALSKPTKTITILGTIIWPLVFGIPLAICHLIAGIINLMMCVFLVTIPINLPHALAHFKLIPVAFNPIGVRLVPVSLATAIEDSLSKSKL